MTALATIRRAVHEDYAELGKVMFDAIRHGCPAYTPEQLAAWAPAPPVGPQWNQRLEHQQVFVAEVGGEVLGFLSLCQDGLIDLAFIRSAAQGTGLFRRIYQKLEQTALERGLPQLKVYASLAAEPAFSAVGFMVKQQESVCVRNQTLLRYEMYKRLF